MVGHSAGSWADRSAALSVAPLAAPWDAHLVARWVASRARRLAEMSDVRTAVHWAGSRGAAMVAHWVSKWADSWVCCLAARMAQQLAALRAALWAAMWAGLKVLHLAVESAGQKAQHWGVHLVPRLAAHWAFWLAEQKADRLVGVKADRMVAEMAGR